MFFYGFKIRASDAGNREQQVVLNCSPYVKSENPKKVK
jgi:hypothetical protein